MDLVARIFYGNRYQGNPFMGSKAMSKKIFYCFFILSLIVIVDITASFLWFETIIEKENNLFDKKVQVGVLFMGSFEKDYTGMSKDTLRRIRHGADLYTKGLMNRILCVGGSRPDKQVFGSEMMKEKLIELGVPPEKIFTETESYDSATNWQMALKLIVANHWKTVVVISSPLHVHRIRKIISEKPMKQLSVFYSPYSYRSFKDTALSLSSFEIWRQVKHEWVAYLMAYILPDSVYRSVLRFIRHQRSTLFSRNSQSSSTIA
jgi:uncharacterized SAM-binding protein YcdF (DUF218 family)